MSDIQRLGSNPPLQNLRDISETAPAQKLERTTSMQQLPGQRSNFQKPALSRTSSFVAQSTEANLIQSKIENIAPEQIRAKAAFVPKPGALLKMHAQITGEATLGKLESLDQSTRDKTLNPLKQEHQRLQTETGDDGIAQTRQMPLDGLQKSNPEKLSSMMKMFSGISQEMDKSVFKDKSLNKANALARQMMNNSTSNIDGQVIKTADLKFMLATLPEAEAKDALAKGMGLIKDKYQDASYGQLSAHKQRLVDQVYSGMKSSIAGQENQIAAAKANEINQKIADAFKVPNGPKAAEFLVRTDSENIAYIAESLGLPAGELEQMPAPAQHLLNNCLHKIKAEVQTKCGSISSETTEVHDKHGTAHQAPENLTLGDKTYAHPTFLGQGGFGKVYSYTNVNDPSDSLVIKEMLGNDELSRRDIAQEVQAHAHMMGEDGKGHPGVVSLKGLVKGGEDNKLFMVMEKAVGDLEDGLEKLHADSSPLNSAQKQLLARYVARETLQSLQYVQRDKNAQHMDIKPQNMLLSADGRAMVADFGSTVLDHEAWDGVRKADGIKTGTTPGYAAPEYMVNGNAVATEKYDTWSTGVMLHNIMGQEFGVLKDASRFEIADRLREFGGDTANRARSTYDSHKNLDSFDNVVNALNHPDPAQRPTLEAVLQHSFFQDPELNKPEVQQLWVAVLNNDQAEINRLKDLI
ncbi:MAG: protein kinase [Candidatus Sericytochromatia bacterium]|nr:protein kinase [Candidatus Sericytochromatia bacterium]